MNIGYADIIISTNSNLTHEYYMVSQSSSNFASNEINCTSRYCHIICDANYGSCSKLMVDSSLSDTLSMECIADASCDGVTIYAESTKNVNITCYKESISSKTNNIPCYNLTVNALYSSFVNINCFGVYSCYQSYFHLDYAQYAEIICSSNDFGCYNNSYYIPYNTIFNCYGNGCGDLGNIYLTTNSSEIQINAYGCGECDYFSDCIGSFYLNCGGDGNYNSSYSYNAHCSTSGQIGNDYCGCNDLLINHYRRTEFIATTNVDHCYDIIITKHVFNTRCESGTDCTVNCDDKYVICSNVLINASSSNYLTLSCDANDGCQYSTIICPNNGCHIKCNADYACFHTNIIYNGVLQDVGHVNIHCNNNEYSCYYTEITANNADTVSLHCNAPETGNGVHICNSLILNAKYVNKVYIVGNYRYAIMGSRIYVNNAVSVSLNARGYYVFRENYLYAANAGSVSIKCVSEVESLIAACSNSHWYLPSDSVFNCYGKGCDNVGTLYIESANNILSSDISININGCGDCDDKADCFGSITFQCGSEYQLRGQYNSDSNNNDDSCTNCSCSEFIDNNIAFKDDDTDNQCYEPHWTTAQIVGLYIGVPLGFCICICLGLYIQKKGGIHCNKERHTDRNQVESAVELEEANKSNINNQNTNKYIIHSTSNGNNNTISGATTTTKNDTEVIQTKPTTSVASIPSSAPIRNTAVPVPGVHIPSAPSLDNGVGENVAPPSYSDVNNEMEGHQEITEDINNEYITIESILKECDTESWKGYLDNFKKHKITDERMKLLGNTDSSLWKELIPEIGNRLQFYALWEAKQNDKNIGTDGYYQ